MKSRMLRTRLPLILLALSLAGATSGCRKRGPATSVVPVVPAAPRPELPLATTEIPGALFRTVENSAIRWQPFTKETLELARLYKRPVFAMVVMPQQSGYQRVLEKLQGNPDIAKIINEEYVPILIDGDASREVGLLIAGLCAEIKRNLQLPLMLWLTPDANPITWIPSPEEGNPVELFAQSNSMIRDLWLADNSYMLNNSSLDNASRRERMLEPLTKPNNAADTPENLSAAMRKLASLYDVVSRNFFDSGGLFPTSAMDFLAASALTPGVPSDLRARSLSSLREMSADLLSSAMFDPLDGGVYLSRQGNVWSLPAFNRDCPTQGKVVHTLARLNQATGDPLALQRAREVLKFAEDTYLVEGGLFSFGVGDLTNRADWLWSVEDVKKALPEQDAKWWIAATGMKDLGNLPSEADPARELFRKNTLALVQPLDAVAARLGADPAEFRASFEKSRAALLEIRRTRMGTKFQDRTPHAGAALRMVSAYSAMFSATGEEAFRTRAVELLERWKTAFSEDVSLRMYEKPAAASLSAGRANLYGLAIQAANDVADITSREIWTQWATELASEAERRFAEGSYLAESSAEARVIDLPISDTAMLFDVSSFGLMAAAEARAKASKTPFPEKLALITRVLPRTALERPILHTDLLQAAVVRHFSTRVLIGKNPPEELAEAARRLPLRVFTVQSSAPASEVPEGSAKIIRADGTSEIATSGAALREALLPPSNNL